MMDVNEDRMSDQVATPVNTLPAGGAATPPTPAATPPAPSPAGVSAEKHAAALERASAAEAKAKELQAAEAASAKVKADSKQSKAIADAIKRAEAAEAQVATYQKQQRAQTIRAALPKFAGSPELVRAVMPMFEAAAEFGDDGALTDKATEALKALTESNAHLFVSAQSTGSQPMAQGTFAPAQGSWSPEDRAMFATLGVKPGEHRRHPAWTGNGGMQLIFGQTKGHA